MEHTFIKEYKNGMKIEEIKSKYGSTFIVWHNGSPIKRYPRYETAVWYISTF